MQSSYVAVFNPGFHVKGNWDFGGGENKVNAAKCNYHSQF